MKKILLIAALLIGAFSYGQVTLSKATKYLGLTTTQRNTITVNANEFPVIYNTTTGQFERYNGSAWETWVAGESITESQISDLQTYTLPADFDTFAELDALVADEPLLKAAAISPPQTLEFARFTSPNTIEGLTPTEAYTEFSGLTATITNKTISGASNTITGITSAMITDGTIAAADMGISSVSSNNIINESITTSDILNGTIVPADLTAMSQYQLISRLSAGTGQPSLINGSSFVDGLNITTNSNTQTLTNKTIAGASNTISGITSTMITDATIDEADLDASVNASLDLADSASQTDDQTAAEVTIADSGALITATDVEGALAENRTAIDLNTAKVSSDLQQADINTYSELNTIVADQTLTHNGLIDTSAEIAAITTDETGSGALVFATSPTLVTPALGTPSSGVGTNITGVVSSNVTYDNTISALTATDVKAALDELENEIDTNISDIADNGSEIVTTNTRQDSIVTALGTASRSAFTFEAKTADYTAVLADAEDDKIITLTYDDEEATIPSGVYASGESLRFISLASTTAYIKEGSGVDILGVDGLKLDSIYKAVTVARLNTNTSPEQWVAIDGYAVDGVLAVAYSPNNVYTGGTWINADNNLDVRPEFDANDTNKEVIQSTDNAGNSTYSAHMKMLAANTQSYRTHNLDLSGYSLAASTTYDVSFNWKYPQAGEVRILTTGTTSDSGTTVVTTAQQDTFTSFTGFSFTTDGSPNDTELKWRIAYNLPNVAKSFYLADLEIVAQ